MKDSRRGGSPEIAAESNPPDASPDEIAPPRAWV